MSKPVSGLNVFQAQAGPIPLSQLDANFTLQTNALNDTATYSNYFADSSGAANTITVTVTAPLTFAYVTGISLQVKLANTNTLTTVNANVNALGNKAVINNDGSLPAVGSLVANSILSLMYDGVSLRLLSQTGTAFINTGLFADGSAGTPSISFAADPDTGIYRVGTNSIGFSAGGSRRMSVSDTQIFSTVAFQPDDGSAGAPIYSFNNDPDTGIYRVGTNNIGIVSGGSAQAFWDLPGLRFANSLQIHNQDGTVSLPGYSFGSDTDTGFYRPGSGRIRLIGNTSVLLDADQVGNNVTINTPLWTADGGAGAPALAFSQDTDTGFYRDTANQIGIALGGVTAGQIAQGSFTVTITGCTTSPTGTAEYQRIGNHCIVFLPPVSATSNSTSFTYTGFPAIIQCPSGSGEMYVGSVLNGGASTTSATAQLTPASGTLTMLLNGSPIAWSGAGTKGTSTSGNVIVYKVR